MSTHPAGFRQDDKYNNGEILDPKTGRIYGTKMTLQDGRKKLNVRGCIGFPLLGRSRFGFAKIRRILCDGLCLEATRADERQDVKRQSAENSRLDSFIDPVEKPPF
jgi:hypothetical protein